MDKRNSPSHTSVLTQQFLAKNKMTVIPHPPCPPELEPYDLFVFPKIKLKLIGHRFDTIEESQAQSQRVLDTLTEKDFQEAFPKTDEMVGLLSTRRRELLRG
jgi:hypothetical protein